jgi:hypothetical protein
MAKLVDLPAELACILPLHYLKQFAAVAKLADALASGASARKGLEVQLLSAAPR